MKVNKWNEKGKDDENKKNLKRKKERQKQNKSRTNSTPPNFLHYSELINLNHLVTGRLRKDLFISFNH